jgi:hypothetical protein
VENKEHGLGSETNFDFKYIPNFDTKTELGEYEPSSNPRSVETRNLRTLVLASAVMGGVGYVWFRTTWGFIGLAKTWLS